MHTEDHELRRLFSRFQVLDMPSVESRFPGRSRRSLYRDLARIGYLSSYTQRGRYYTLADIPAFDERGLWFHRDVGFSQAGTLKQTVAAQVQEAPNGHVHAELQNLLRVRVHNTLLGLVREGRIGREQYKNVHLYVSADPDRAAEQVQGRREVDEVLALALRMPTTEETTEILAEALRAAPEIPEPALVARRLAARIGWVEPRHVQQVYESYGLKPGKKTARPSWTSSRH